MRNSRLRDQKESSGGLFYFIGACPEAEQQKQQGKCVYNMKNNNHKVILTFLIVLMPVCLLFLSGCRKNDSLIDFPVALTLELREVFLNDARHTALFVSTVQEYECINYEIEFQYTQTTQHRHIAFTGIYVPSTCATAIGPATAYILLGEMDTDRHDVLFDIDKDLLKTAFDVDDSSIHVVVEEGETELLDFVEYTMKRLPEDYVWGYIIARSSANQNSFDDFFDKLWNTGALPQDLPPGNYGFFRITEDKEMILFSYDVSYCPDHFFICTTDNDFYKLQAVAESFSAHYVIVLFSARGDYYHNQL